MAKVFHRNEMPQFDSTRDGRDRLDLIKAAFPEEGSGLWADRIIYHPGDTCAKHYHIGSYHLFAMLAGEIHVCTPDSDEVLVAGQSALIQPEQVHWFENHSEANATFVEFWAPPPEETIWIVEDDI